MAKVSTDLPEGMQALFDQCLDRALYGGEAATVRAFITMGIERLIEQRRIIDTPAPPHRPATQPGIDDGEAKTG
jgi:hypothetical protein